MILNRVVLFVVCFSIVVLVGCESQCELNNEPGVEITFYQQEFSKRFSRPFHNVHGMGTNHEISQDDQDKNYFLPFSLNHDTVSFVFRLEDENDTITFSYDRTSEIDKGGCGFYLQFKNLRILHSTFDSIRYPMSFRDEPDDNQFKLDINR